MRSYGIHALAALVVLSLTMPGAAQQTQSAGRVGQVGGACGQPAALTYTLPAPLDQAAMAPLAAELPRGEPAYLEFTLAAEARVALRAEAPDGVTDAYLAVFSTSGAVVAQDDDSAGGYNPQVDLTLAAGTYCARIEPYSATVNYTVALTLLAGAGAAAEAIAAMPGPDTSGDAALFCSDPALMVDAGGDIGPGMGRRLLSLDLAEGGRQDLDLNVAAATELQIDASSGALDTVIRLARDGSILTENDDGPSGTDSQLAVALEPGIYCLSVTSYDGAAGPVTLTLTDEPTAPVTPIVGDIGTACTDPALTSAFGAPLAPGVGTVSATGALAGSPRSDWTIEVTETVTLQLDARSVAFDTVLTLLDGSGSVIDTNDDGPSGTDSRLVSTLQPGSYCLAVEAFDAGEGAFELVLSDTVDPAPVDLGGVAGCSDPAMTADLGQTLAPGLGNISLAATLAENTRQDWTMTVTDEAALRIDARSGAFDTVLKLADSAGTLIAENDDGPDGGTDSRIEVTLAPGDYCLTLEGFAGAGGAAQIAVSEGGAAPVFTPTGPAVTPPEPGSGVEIEELGALEALVQANKISTEQTKWIAFEVAGATGVRIDAVSVSGSFALRLFDAAGAVVAETQGWGGLAPTQLTADLQPGRYLVGMTMDETAAMMLRSITVQRDGG